MERAIYVTKISGLANLNAEFSRVYFGNEFCERLIPKVEDVREMLEFALKKEAAFSFVTPYVTNKGIEILNNIFAFLTRESPGCEVIFNDYGVLRVLLNKFSELKPVMGRLLNKMKRDPRLMNLIDILPETTVKYFKSSSLETQAFRNFLAKSRIERVELDNLLQGIELNLSRFGISASLYVPYAYVTTTRACLAINCDVHGQEDNVGIFPCKKECQRYTFYLKSEVMPVLLIRKGNTIFLRNERIPENLDKIGVNRIVYEPYIPI
ncbi:MAG: hypothetical protein RMJ15_08485 [Nitrososphaerota archaeon]|nr:hypothetical protein [Candidatus Bathyarchaeota archaeon]MDW8023754.1 hypothetical protein [Nitrososphaerota archaeon]